MKSVISSSFSIAAQKEAVSIDHIDNYYLIEATGTTPSATDSKWQKVEEGGTVPVPTSTYPFLWHKYIIFFTDGTSQAPIIEFKSSLGKNGIDYDLVPSHSSILKAEDGTLTPTAVSCAMILRNADGSAQTLTTMPDGYSIVAYRDTTASNYTLGSTVSTSGVSVVSFVLKYGTVEVERHDLFVITEGAQGINGRGIQSQEVRFKALTSASTPATPTDTTWSQWSSLANCGYSSTNCYLYKCIKTTFIDGNNNTTTEYYVEGPTVWGKDGETPFTVDIDNEMTAVPVDSDGKLSAKKTISFGLKAWYGTSDVTSNCEVACTSSLPSGFSVDVTTSKSAPSITIAANTAPAELTELTFRVKHATYGERNVVFSIAAIKSGGVGNDAVIYQLLPSATELSVARTTDGGYNPSTVALTCGYTKRTGNSEATSVTDVTAAFDGYNIYFRLYNRSTGWGTYYRYYSYKSTIASLAVATYSKIELVLCKSTDATTSSLTGIIDRETVPIIADGINGTSPYILDLDKEMTSVALTSAGVTEAAFSETFALKAFYGSTDVTSGVTSVKASVSPANTNVVVDTSSLSAIAVTIASGKALDEKTEITLTCVHPTYGSRTIVHTLAGIRAGQEGAAAVLYEILPDLTQISFGRTSAGALTPASRTVTFNIKKIVGASVSVLSLANSGLTLRYSYSSMPASVSAGTAIPSSSPSLTIASSTTNSNLYVAAFSGSTMVDRETIPILKDGAKGDEGNGIDTVSYARMFTTALSAPASSDSGWTEGRTLTESGLSQTNRYLWERKKTTYTTSSDIDYEVYLIAQYAASFDVDIDNEMTAVPVDTDGKLSAEKILSFGLNAWYGTENVISACEVSCITTTPAGFTIDTSTKATPMITIASGTAPSELTELTFRVTHATFGSRDVVFSIATVKSGGVGDDAVIYQLLPSDSQVSVGRTDAGGYNPSTVTITCGYTKRKGNAEATTVADVTAAFDGYNIYFRQYNRSSGWTTYYRYYTYKSRLASMAVASYSKVEFVMCKSTATTTSTLTGVIDRETVPILVDGLNGTSPFIVDLDNDMSSVALTNAGVVASAFSETLALTAWYGTTAVTLSSVTASVSPTNSGVVIDSSDLSAIKISIAAGVTLAETTTITFTCTHSSYGTRTITHTLAGIKAGAEGQAATLYGILADLTQISFGRTSAGVLTPTSRTVSFSVKKTVGTTTTVLSLANSGLTLRYSYSSMPTSSTSGTAISTSSPSLTIYSATTYTNLYLALFNGTTLVDRETIPILKDGAKGGTGETGNGIDTVSYARQFTMGFEAPSNTDSGWTDGRTLTESGLSQTNRYLWERKKTTYTTSSDIDYEIYLVAQFASGVMANLLEDTAFVNNDMDGWDLTNGSVMPVKSTGLTNNGWQLSPDREAQYTEMLRQIVWDGSNVKKIKANTWYTLSFYGAEASYDTIFSGSTYNGKNNTSYYQIRESYSKVRIEAGQSVTVTFRGYVNNATTAFMRCYAWLNSLDETTTWIKNVSTKITSTSATTVTVTITNDQSSACYCHFAAYMFKADDSQVTDSDTSTDYRGYITLVRVNRGMMLDTYLYRSGNSTTAIDTSSPWYVDGQKVTAATTLSDGTYVSHGVDGNVRWKLNGSATRHSVTFKTTSFGTSTTDLFRVLFRLTAYANYGWISMPKLEENTMATEWLENSNDRYAADFQHIYVGEFVLNTYYLYADGVRHVVRAKESASGSMIYWRMKNRTTSTGYYAEKEPYLDTDNWEKANFLKFIATDLLLADEVITDKLTVSKVHSANDTFVIDEDGNITAKGGTFTDMNAENATISGKLVGVTGSFKTLQCVNSSGNVVGEITFGTDGRLWFSGDMYHQGNNSEKSRSYRFYTSDLWCRGVFGARARTVLRVCGTYGYYYPTGLSGTSVYVSFTQKTSSSGDTYYELPMYGSTGDYAGMPVDILVFNYASDLNYNYNLTNMIDSQRVLVVNASDKYNKVYIFSNGNKVQWSGGEVAEVVKLASLLLPTVGTSVLGRGLLVGAFRDNNWS